VKCSIISSFYQRTFQTLEDHLLSFSTFMAVLTYFWLLFPALMVVMGVICLLPQFLFHLEQWRPLHSLADQQVRRHPHHLLSSDHQPA